MRERKKVDGKCLSKTPTLYCGHYSVRHPEREEQFPAHHHSSINTNQGTRVPICGLICLGIFYTDGGDACR